jgi:flagellin-like protein
MKGVSTVIATVLMLVITIALAAMAYGVISGWFTSSSQGIEVSDSFCNTSGSYLKIKNFGSAAITSIKCIQTSPPTDVGAPCTNTSQDISMVIQPGQSSEILDACQGTGGRSCIYRLTPPIGKTITATVYCT